MSKIIIVNSKEGKIKVKNAESRGSEIDQFIKITEQQISQQQDVLNKKQ